MLRRTLGVVPCPVPALGHSASPETAQLQASIASAGFWPLDLLNILIQTKPSASRWYLSLLNDLAAMDGDERWSEVTCSLSDVLTLKCPHCGIAVGMSPCFSMRFAMLLRFPSFSFIFLRFLTRSTLRLVDPSPDACSAVMCLLCASFYCNCCFARCSDSSDAHQHAATHHPAALANAEAASAFLPREVVGDGQRRHVTELLRQWWRSDAEASDEAAGALRARKEVVLCLQREELLRDWGVDVCGLAADERRPCSAAPGRPPADSAASPRIRSPATKEEALSEAQRSVHMLRRAIIAENASAADAIVSALTTATRRRGEGDHEHDHDHEHKHEHVLDLRYDAWFAQQPEGLAETRGEPRTLLMLAALLCPVSEGSATDEALALESDAELAELEHSADLGTRLALLLLRCDGDPFFVFPSAAATDAPPGDGRSAAFIAIERGQLRLLQLWLRCARDATADFVQLAALRRGFPPRLPVAGAAASSIDADVRTERYVTALCVALLFRRTRVVQFLLAQEPDGNSSALWSVDAEEPSCGTTPLQLAARCGDRDAALALLLRGADCLKCPLSEQRFADVDTARIGRRSALGVAVERGYVGLIDAMLSLLRLRGHDAVVALASLADAPTQRTALHLAALYHQGPALRSLLRACEASRSSSRGDLLDAVDAEGFTALEVALATGDGDAALQLVRAGASVTLHPALLADASRSPRVRATQLREGRGAVFLAAERGIVAVMRFLGDAPALQSLLTAPCVPTEPPATPLTVAATFAQWRCCAALARLPHVRATLRRDAGAFLRVTLLVIDQRAAADARLLPGRAARRLRAVLCAECSDGDDSPAAMAQLRRRVTSLLMPQGAAASDVGGEGSDEDEDDGGWSEAREEALVALLNADGSDADDGDDARVKSTARRQWLHRDSGLLSQVLQRIVRLRRGSDRALELLSQATCGAEGSRRPLACEPLWTRDSAACDALLHLLGPATSADAGVAEAWCRSATAQLLLFDNAAALSVLLLGGSRGDWSGADVDVLRRLADALGAHRCAAVLARSEWVLGARAQL